MSASIVVLAADKSEVPFYIAGGVLAAWAVAVSLYSLRRPDFPSGRAGQAVTILVSAVLVVVTAAMGVLTANSPSHASAATPSAPSAPAPSSRSTQTPSPSGSSTTLSESADPSGALHYTASTLHAKAGRVTIDFANSSPVSHNLTVASGSKVLGATPTFQGGSHSLTLNLKPGTYQFYCSVPGHRQAGMHGTLVVR